MVILGQRDSRWADEHLGDTNYTVARYGCLITCISMLTDYFQSIGKGAFKTPKTLAQQLKFTKDGYVNWGSLKTCTQMKLDMRVYNRDDVGIAQYLKDPKKAVVLQVNGNHWICAVKKIGSVIQCADPWLGDKCFAGTKLTRYPKITGMALLSLNT